VTLTAGTRIGGYEVVAALGAGGMGEVYRARDTKLNRDVALKILPDAFALDADRIARFKREAQVLASLNHPNIGAIYGFEDGDGVHALVLELVDGPTLADRIAEGPLPPDEALPIAKQLADALEAAHEQGIVHRDLKPANIKVRADGAVKVLDFGLAKLAEPAAVAGTSTLTQSPTITTPAMTMAGVILGTAAYMSPEQAKGRAADKRSDIWAFGCVLYEMLTGTRAFEGDDATDIIAAVLRAEPDWSALPPTVTPPLRAIIKRCLEKDRKTRIPDMSVVRFLIADAENAPQNREVAAATSATRRMVLLTGIAAAVGAAIAAVATWGLMRSPPTSAARPVRFTIVPPGGQPIGGGGPDRSIVISSDGSRIVYVTGSGVGGGGQLVVRDLAQGDAVTLRGVTNGRAPFVSPDGRWVGFFDAGNLKKVPVRADRRSRSVRSVAVPGARAGDRTIRSCSRRTTR